MATDLKRKFMRSMDTSARKRLRQKGTMAEYLKKGSDRKVSSLDKRVTESTKQLHVSLAALAEAIEDAELNAIADEREDDPLVSVRLDEL